MIANIKHWIISCIHFLWLHFSTGQQQLKKNNFPQRKKQTWPVQARYLASHLGCKFINVWAQALSWGHPQDWVKVCVQYTGGPDLIVIKNDPVSLTHVGYCDNICENCNQSDNHEGTVKVLTLFFLKIIFMKIV